MSKEGLEQMLIGGYPNSLGKTVGVVDLKLWLLPQLRKFSKSPRKSVANRAKKMMDKFVYASAL